MRAAVAGRPGRPVIETDPRRPWSRPARRRAADLGLDNVEARVMDAERMELPDASVDARGLPLGPDADGRPGGLAGRGRSASCDRAAG